MFDKTEEVKVLRDPIHGYIHIEYQVIWNCLNSKEFQRLRRIHQLGGVFQVYHTAQHTRFSHSLGVYEIVRRMVTENNSISSALTMQEKVEAFCAGLLHDLGHGPFSHFFESLQSISHEERTILLIQDPSTEVYQALIRENRELPNQITKILRHSHENEILNQIISSQLDADRMDYLLRDAYETGTSYGNFDLERVLRTLRVHDGKLCVKESGVHSIEDYIMARYHMYWQVYLHPDAKSYELLVKNFFKRYRDVDEKIDLIDCLKNENLDNEEFLKMDEYRLMVGIQLASSGKDRILKDLSYRIFNRHLLEWIENPDLEMLKKIKKDTKQKYDVSYYFYEDIQALHAYLPYQEKNPQQTIWILKPNCTIQPLSNCSQIVKSLLKMENNPDLRVYYAK